MALMSVYLKVFSATFIALLDVILPSSPWVIKKGNLNQRQHIHMKAIYARRDATSAECPEAVTHPCSGHHLLLFLSSFTILPWNILMIVPVHHLCIFISNMHKNL